MKINIQITDEVNNKSYEYNAEITSDEESDTPDLHDAVEILSNELNDYMDGVSELEDLFKDVKS